MNEKLTILTVEDNLTTRKSFAMFLTARGFHVLEAENGRIGLELYQREQPDLILLDLRMPEVDGMEVLNRITAESPDLPIIVVSGVEKTSEAVLALKHGAWDFILKPIQDMSVLYHSVQRCLERGMLIRENRRYQLHLEDEIKKRTTELQEANYSLLREIRQRKKIEEALRINERAYRDIFNADTAALIIVDNDNRMVEANTMAGKYFGRSPAQFPGGKAALLFIPEHRERFRLLQQKAREQGRAQRELTGIRDDGSHMLGEVVITQVSYKGNEFLLLVFRDITERKIAEENEIKHQQQLIQADKMASLGVLVSSTAHEINNPNNFIMVNAPILTRIWKSTQPVLDKHFEENGDFYIAPRVNYSEMKDNIPGIISGIMEGAQRIDHFVKALKNFARPAPTTQERNIDINNVVRAALRLQRDLIHKSTSCFQVVYGEALPPVIGNFQQLEQVVINLVENSCQALTHRDRALTIQTSYDKPQDMVEILIKDEGVGIAQTDLPVICNAFFTTKRDQGGTGLGLSISSKIVDKHGGKLIFSSGPQQGTTAQVRLPVQADVLTTPREII